MCDWNSPAISTNHLYYSCSWFGWSNRSKSCSPLVRADMAATNAEVESKHAETGPAHTDEPPAIHTWLEVYHPAVLHCCSAVSNPRQTPEPPRIALGCHGPPALLSQDNFDSLKPPPCITLQPRVRQPSSSPHPPLPDSVRESLPKHWHFRIWRC
jgi:hypothetical protein